MISKHLETSDPFFMPRMAEFPTMKTFREYIDTGIRELFNSVGSVGKDISITESARRIAYRMRGVKYHYLSPYKFDDLLGDVIQNSRATCADENILCTYLMWYIEFSDVEEDIVTVLRSRLQYLDGDIAGQVKAELVFRDL